MRCVDLWGATSNRESARRKAIGGRSSASISLSMDISSQFKEFSISSQSGSAYMKIIHAGGQVERYVTSFPASIIMEKYPGTCVARPDVFRRPHECILSANEMLLPSHKYFLLPCSTAKKLKHKHQGKAEPKKEAVQGREKLPEKKVEAEVEFEGDIKAVVDEGYQTGESTPGAAKGFFVSKERSPGHSPRRKLSKFVPPIPRRRRRRRMLRQLTWEPSLSSVQELSP
ncbi:hypothetical protein MLD38_003213 [Melastoma candidum]|uniref:Uncharacterized protein n=1 Tax=Melastoma candidum TaxID=119954 RepID=A0ACB9S1D0_9MYRT|nr:hypothetical protein MLD38_003213 [Melastoma candidum]